MIYCEKDDQFTTVRERERECVTTSVIYCEKDDQFTTVRERVSERELLLV